MKKYNKKQKGLIKKLVNQAAEDKYFSEQNYAAVIETENGFELVCERELVKDNIIIVETDDFKYEWRLAEKNDDFWIGLGLMKPKPSKNWIFNDILGLGISIPETVTEVIEGWERKIENLEEIVLTNTRYLFRISTDVNYQLHILDSENYNFYRYDGSYKEGSVFKHQRYEYKKVVVYNVDVTTQLYYNKNNHVIINIKGLEHGIIEWDLNKDRCKYYPAPFYGNSWNYLIRVTSYGTFDELLKTSLYGECQIYELFFNKAERTLCYLSSAAIFDNNEFNKGKFITENNEFVNIKFSVNKDKCIGFIGRSKDVFFEIAGTNRFKKFNFSMEFICEVEKSEVDCYTPFDIAYNHAVFKEHKDLNITQQ